MIDFDKCGITHYPAVVLGKPAEAVETIDGDIRRLVEKMTEIMLENKGVGLAAPQAGVSLRLFIISLDGTRDNVKVYINPTVTRMGELYSAEEGCLSVPDYTGNVVRAERIQLAALDRHGNALSFDMEGFEARAIQHEMDHLDGLLFLDRLVSRRQDLFQRKVYK